MPNVQMLYIKDLTLLDRNPRRISKDQMDKLCKSIKNDPDFLNGRPVLVHEKDGIFNVYAGNQRVKAAKKIGWKTIPCIVESGLSEDVIKQRILKDNKTYGDFDFDMLANEWDLNVLLDCGFTTADFGGIEADIDLPDEDKEEKKNTKKCPECGCEF